MQDREIIDKAFNELKEWPKPYMMFKEFSFMAELDKSEDLFQKYRFLLVNAEPFEKHSDHAIKFSPKGVEINMRHGDWNKYLKSQKTRIDYVKWIAVFIAAISLGWNVYQDIKNDQLKLENDKLKRNATAFSNDADDQIEATKKEDVILEDKAPTFISHKNTIKLNSPYTFTKNDLSFGSAFVDSITHASISILSASAGNFGKAFATIPGRRFRLNDDKTLDVRPGQNWEYQFSGKRYLLSLDGINWGKKTFSASVHEIK